MIPEHQFSSSSVSCKHITASRGVHQEEKTIIMFGGNSRPNEAFFVDCFIHRYLAKTERKKERRKTLFLNFSLDLDQLIARKAETVVG